MSRSMHSIKPIKDENAEIMPLAWPLAFSHLLRIVLSDRSVWAANLRKLEV